MEKSQNIEISAISFILLDNFTYIIRFEQSLFVQLSNISIYGNGHSGCSSVISQESTLQINNAIFLQIRGLLGAAIMIVASNVSIRGTNNFVENTATSGSSIYLSDGMLTLNGTNLFLNNGASRSGRAVVFEYDYYNKLCKYHVSIDKRRMRSVYNGGAIFSITSYLRINGHSNFTGNIAKSYGGAISVDTGDLTIQGIALFNMNNAKDGGAIALRNTLTTSSESVINKNFSLNQNKYQIRNVIIEGYTLFNRNSAKKEGGAMYIMSWLIVFGFKFCGNIHYENNVADGKGGALYVHRADAPFDTTCGDAIMIPHYKVIGFFNNTGEGGCIYCSERSSVYFFGIVHFNESQSSAIIIRQYSNITFLGTTYFCRNIGDKGGAIQNSDSSILFSGTVHFEKNTANVGGAMWLEKTSKLILKPKLSMHFVLNLANESGGALL